MTGLGIKTGHRMGTSIRRVFSMFEDKTLVCRECGAEFVFTASEQQFYAEKGFQNEPGRCTAGRATAVARTMAALVASVRCTM